MMFRIFLIIVHKKLNSFIVMCVIGLKASEGYDPKQRRDFFLT